MAKVYSKPGDQSMNENFSFVAGASKMKGPQSYKIL